MKTIGDKASICFELKDVPEMGASYRIVNLWISGEIASACDEAAYLPTYCSNLKEEIDRLTNSGFRISGLDESEDAEIFEYFENNEIGIRHEILNFDVSIHAATIYLLQKENEWYLIYKILGSRVSRRSNPVVASMSICINELISLLSELSKALPDRWNE